MIKLYDLTVLFVDQVVTAPTEGPVDSDTRLRTGVALVDLIETSFLEKISVVTTSLKF